MKKQSSKWIKVTFQLWNISFKQTEGKPVNLLHMALLGLTCCPMRNCCSFLMSTLASTMTSGSLLWDRPPSWEASSPAGTEADESGIKGEQTRPSWAPPSAQKKAFKHILTADEYAHHGKIRIEIFLQTPRFKSDLWRRSCQLCCTETKAETPSVWRG